MIPKSIQPYFKTTCQKNRGNDNLTMGVLTCCDAQDFEVYVGGEIRHSVFSKMYLYPENDSIAIEARCRRCGKIVDIFDCCRDGFDCCRDGYDSCEKDQNVHILTGPICCMKCRNESFSAVIKYEYTDIQELEEHGIKELDNAFSWINVTLNCNNCGTRYKNFVDWETA